ncbi:MAG: hypothetical protein EOO65_05820, partial [Methanosarcinales archaeon]
MQVESVVNDFVQTQHLADVMASLAGSLTSGALQPLLVFEDVDGEGPLRMLWRVWHVCLQNPVGRHAAHNSGPHSSVQMQVTRRQYCAHEVGPVMTRWRSLARRSAWLN